MHKKYIYKKKKKINFFFELIRIKKIINFNYKGLIQILKYYENFKGANNNKSFFKKIKYRTIINPFKFECIHNTREGVQKVRGGHGSLAPTSTTGVRY